MANGWLVPVVAQVLLFALSAGMAASVDTAVLRDKFKRWQSIALGLFFQFCILPFVGFCTVRIFDLDPVFGIALLAVTSSPGGAYSNWWCSLFNADLALSIAMTTCSTLVSVAATPLNLIFYANFAYGRVPELNWGSLLGSIAVVVCAILTGTLISICFPQRRRLFNVLGNIGGLCLIIFSAVVSSSDDPIWDKDTTFYVAVALPCLAALLIAFVTCYLFPRISGPECVAVTVETSYQNTGLALAIALATFGEEDRARAAGVPLYYGCVQVVCLPLFLLCVWKAGLTLAPRHIALHRAILGDFQPKSDAKVVPAPPPTSGGEIVPTTSPFDQNDFPESECPPHAPAGAQNDAAEGAPESNDAGNLQ